MIWIFFFLWGNGRRERGAVGLLCVRFSKIMRWSLKFSILRVSSSFVRIDQGLWFRLFFLLGLIVFSFPSNWESSSLFRGHEGDDLDFYLHRFPL